MNLGLLTSGFYPWIEFGDFRIQSYFVVISLVCCALAFYIPRRAQALGLDVTRALDLYIGILISGFLGSRLTHVVWEEPAYYLEEPQRVFDIMAGGFVWYGGALAAMAFMFWRLRIDRARFEWLDFFAPITELGYAGGRVACFLTGCCYGAVCDWPLIVPHPFHFPTQAMAVLIGLGVALYLMRRQKRLAMGSKSGAIFFLWLVLHGLGRVLTEAFRADPRGPAWGPVSLAVVISFALVVLGLVGALKLRKT